MYIAHRTGCVDVNETITQMTGRFTADRTRRKKCTRRVNVDETFRQLTGRKNVYRTRLTEVDEESKCGQNG